MKDVELFLNSTMNEQIAITRKKFEARLKLAKKMIRDNKKL